MQQLGGGQDSNALPEEGSPENEAGRNPVSASLLWAPFIGN
jgi:hypothetical protein